MCVCVCVAWVNDECMCVKTTRTGQCVRCFCDLCVGLLLLVVVPFIVVWVTSIFLSDFHQPTGQASFLFLAVSVVILSFSCTEILPIKYQKEREKGSVFDRTTPTYPPFAFWISSRPKRQEKDRTISTFVSTSFARLFFSVVLTTLDWPIHQLFVKKKRCVSVLYTCVKYLRQNTGTRWLISTLFYVQVHRLVRHNTPFFERRVVSRPSFETSVAFHDQFDCHYH